MTLLCSFQLLNSFKNYRLICLAQGLTKPVTGINSIVMHYLQPRLAATVCKDFEFAVSVRVTKIDDLKLVKLKNTGCL